MVGETRQRILDATEKLVLLKGLGRVTTREIAREVGLSEGALYKHFDHKEEIFFSLMARYLPAFQHTFQEHPPGTGTLSENLAVIVLATIDYYEQIIPMGVSFLADMELLTQLRETLQPFNMGPQNIFERVASYIEEEQRLGRFESQIPALTLAILLLGPCFQWTFNRRFLGSDPFNKTKQQFALELVQGLIAGFQLS